MQCKSIATYARYLGETAQVNTVTALGQSISGSPGLTTYGYLPNSGDRRLNTITFNAAAASNETITTDNADRVNCRTDGTGKIEAYGYDLADRLNTGAVGSACTGGTTSYTETYGLNNADFISSKSGEPTTANNWAATNTGTVNAIGSLTPSGGTGRNYTYDANGNVTNDGVNTYTWDAENRLLSITNIATGHLSSFTYDGLGRRVAITEATGGTSTKTGYLWCETTICAAYNTNGTTTARYLPEDEVQYSGGTATPTTTSATTSDPSPQPPAQPEPQPALLQPMLTARHSHRPEQSRPSDTPGCSSIKRPACILPCTEPTIPTPEDGCHGIQRGKLAVSTCSDM